MPKPPITAAPTLNELLQNPTLAMRLPPEAIAKLAAAVVFRVVSETGHDSAATIMPPEPPKNDGDGWVPVERACELTGYKRGWFFKRKALPFVRQISRKRILVSMPEFHRAAAAGKLNPSDTTR